MIFDRDMIGPFMSTEGYSAAVVGDVGRFRDDFFAKCEEVLGLVIDDDLDINEAMNAVNYELPEAYGMGWHPDLPGEIVIQKRTWWG